ncbi:hypothetical protein VitviT2T_009511 [Vitis vinifera]|uniref:Uncharacterized protein n=1 Tax=Vitis vinifera TaxID=29760 RepID=A0ABY9C510_VITVI|nr:hypothetical protein VitviT2T_009511 [Vitis vinifera]
MANSRVSRVTRPDPPLLGRVFFSVLVPVDARVFPPTQWRNPSDNPFENPFPLDSSLFIPYSQEIKNHTCYLHVSTNRPLPSDCCETYIGFLLSIQASSSTCPR